MTHSENAGHVRLAVGLVLLASFLALGLTGLERGFGWWRAHHGGAPASSPSAPGSR